jgi:hypothetical protein
VVQANSACSGRFWSKYSCILSQPQASIKFLSKYYSWYLKNDIYFPLWPKDFWLPGCASILLTRYVAKGFRIGAVFYIHESKCSFQDIQMGVIYHLRAYLALK